MDETSIIRNIDIVFYGANRWACLKAWYLFFRQEGFVAKESCSVPTVWSENTQSVEVQFPSGRRFSLWFMREHENYLPCGQGCYIDWNVAGWSIFDHLQNECPGRVPLLPSLCDGEAAEDEAWDEATLTDFYRYLGDLFDE